METLTNQTEVQSSPAPTTWSMRLAQALSRKQMDKLQARRRQRGMTLLEIMIVLAILALVMGLVVGPRVMRMFGSSKVDLAKTKAKQFAYEAFTEWSRANPSKACPAGLADLTPNMNTKDINDPWGNPFKMYCGASLPAGVKPFAVSSSGEDGKEGTEDDIKSWED